MSAPSPAADLLKWVEVSRSALAHNLSQFRKLATDGSRLMAVVKSNAYGHGLVEAARVAEEEGIDWLGVNEFEEGRRLREAGLSVPILVLGAIPAACWPRMAELSLSAVVYTEEAIEAVSRAAATATSPLGLHLKIETGLHRQGVPADRALELARIISERPGLVLEGMSTHFANIEDTTDHRYAMEQLRRFREACSLLELDGLLPPLRHTACSAAALVLPETHFTMIRMGISYYGLWSSKETFLSVLQRGDASVSLVPAMTWKTRIVQLKDLPVDAPIGYGCTEKTTHASRLAVLPVGYYDGYDRGFSNVGQVLVRGRRCFVRGRICMNMCMIDVSHVDGVSLGDEVVLLGVQGDEQISAEFLGGQLGTINYEVVTRIAESLPRILTD